MFFPDALLDFVRAHRDELTLSVYIEAAPADPAARRNWRVRLRQGLNDVRTTLASAPGDEQDAFERCAAAVLDSLPSGDAPTASLGWVCFAAASGERFFSHLRDATETTVSWGPGARVVPYIRVATEPRALIVQIDRLHARISRWTEGTLDPLARFEAELTHDTGSHMGDTPQAGFHGGTRGRTRTDEEQRMRADASQRMLAQVRLRVMALVAKHEPILIGGAAEAAGQLLEELPHQLAGRAMLVPALTLQLSDGAALPVIGAALHDVETTLRTRRVTELREMAHAQGRAAVGLRPAKAAADLGALAELIFSESAWRKHPDEIEALVQHALFEGAEVALAPALPDLPLDGDADGVIAALRFPLPTMR